MPASSARATVRFCSVGSPFVNRPPIAPQPNPRTDTLGPLRPMVRYCIVLLRTSSSHCRRLYAGPYYPDEAQMRPTILYPHRIRSESAAPGPVADAWAERGTTVGDDMRILIMGSGGIGGYYGARLTEAGNDVVFVARGAHLEALQTKGLLLREYDGSERLIPVQAVRYPADAGGTFDF